jgi:hypothetical protein
VIKERVAELESSSSTKAKLEKAGAYEVTGNEKNGVEFVKPKNKGRRLALLDMLLQTASNDDLDLDGIREEVDTFMFTVCLPL